MPVYLYQVADTDEVIEVEHSIGESMSVHPETGQALTRVYTAPNIGTRYGSEYSKNLLSDKSLAKSGFTKYVRDPVTRRYNRTVGSTGPTQLKPHG